MEGKQLPVITYDLPKEMIAQKPVEPPDIAKLLVYNRKTNEITHTIFRNITEFLQKDDIMVLNNTRVLPVKLIGKKESGGIVELLIIEKHDDNNTSKITTTLINARKKPRIGEIITFNGGNNLYAKIIDMNCKDGVGSFYRVEFSRPIGEFINLLGKMPLPPYIKRKKIDDEFKQNDFKWYQSIFAENPGSIAAPTASLHFTNNLLEKIKNNGVRIIYLTLHIGIGTFFKLKFSKGDRKKIEYPCYPGEYYQIEENNLLLLKDAHENNKRIIAVGTTVCKALETLALERFQKKEGISNLFIYPPYKFKVTSALITNFHLPLAPPIYLTSAFCGTEKILELYEVAKKENYRFLSYGDAMLIL